MISPTLYLYIYIEKKEGICNEEYKRNNYQNCTYKFLNKTQNLPKVL